MPVTGDLATLIEPLKALANPVRFQVLQWLRDPEEHFPVDPAVTDPRAVGVCVSHIQAKTGLAQSTVSAYMAVLGRAGLPSPPSVGKRSHYRRDGKSITPIGEENKRGGGEATTRGNRAPGTRGTG